MPQGVERRKSVLKGRFQLPKLTSVVKNVQTGVRATFGIDDKQLKLKGNKTPREFAPLNLPPKVRNNTSASSSWSECSEDVEYLIEDSYEENTNNLVSNGTAIYEEKAHRVVCEQAPLSKVNSIYNSRFS